MLILNLLILCYINGFTALRVHHEAALRFKVEQHSNITLYGSSNINRFACHVPQPAWSTPLNLGVDKRGKTYIEGVVYVDIKAFDCKLKPMTRDFQKTLKAQEHQRMAIRFIAMANTIDLHKEQQTIDGIVEVELAGVRQRVELPLRFHRVDDYSMRLQGAHTFDMQDFHLQAPKVAGGLIKINPHVKAAFVLHLTRIE